MSGILEKSEEMFQPVNSVIFLVTFSMFARIRLFVDFGYNLVLLKEMYRIGRIVGKGWTVFSLSGTFMELYFFSR